MNTFSTNQLVGAVLIGTALVDTYILPKILLKKTSQMQEHSMNPQQKAELQKRRQMMKLVITIATLIPAILGVLFFLGIIPIEK